MRGTGKSVDVSRGYRIGNGRNSRQHERGNRPSKSVAARLYAHKTDKRVVAQLGSLGACRFEDRLLEVRQQIGEIACLGGVWLNTIPKQVESECFLFCGQVDAPVDVIIGKLDFSTTAAASFPCGHPGSTMVALPPSHDPTTGFRSRVDHREMAASAFSAFEAVVRLRLRFWLRLSLRHVVHTHLLVF